MTKSVITNGTNAIERLLKGCGVQRSNTKYDDAKNEIQAFQKEYRAQRILFLGGYKMKQSTHAWHTWLATILQYPPVLQQLSVFFLGLAMSLKSAPKR
jgi:hypothetical protein